MRTLLIQPRFPPSYWSYEGLLSIIGKKTLLPPLSLITVAALLPQEWQFKLVDCNAREVTEEDWEWAEIVMISGMIVQKDSMSDLIKEGKRRNKMVAVGGPYYTSVPDDAREAGADYLVLGEGEITIPLFVAALARGETSGVFTANDEKADMTLSPMPRYDLLNLDDYSEMSLQFSRGCPFLCEFCDIIILYGRKPRTKTPEQVIAELQFLHDLGWTRGVFLVDDNFIGNKPKVKPLLEEIVKWQEKNDYPYTLTTEASVNLAEDEELLELMRRACFVAVFLGIETPDTESLALTKKTQNLRQSLVDQVKAINRAGIRVMGGFIIGFDGEKPNADKRITNFINESGIPHAMVSMLQALPETHLMDRLKREGRMIPETDHANLTQGNLMNFIPTRLLRELAKEHVECNHALYEPKNFLARTYRSCMILGERPKRRKTRPPEPREIYLLLVVFWRQGIIRSCRRDFWKYFRDLKKNNPAGLRGFIVCCAHFEHFYEYRKHIRNDIEAQIAKLSDEELDRFMIPPRTEKPMKKPKKRNSTLVQAPIAKAGA